jgi:hypothetical protein
MCAICPRPTISSREQTRIGPIPQIRTCSVLVWFEPLTPAPNHKIFCIALRQRGYFPFSAQALKCEVPEPTPGTTVNETFHPSRSRIGTVNGFFANFGRTPLSNSEVQTPNPAEKLRYFSFTPDSRMLRFHQAGPKIQTSLSSVNGFGAFSTSPGEEEPRTCVRCHADALQAVGNKHRLRKVHRFGLILFSFCAKP